MNNMATPRDITDGGQDANAARGSRVAGSPRNVAPADGTASSATGSSELDAFLEELARNENLQVVATLKTSPHEVTELVAYRGANGSTLGPFIRKRIARVSGLGGAYRVLCDAQRAGLRLQHIPRVYAAFRQDDALVVLMEYVHGATLAELVCHGSCWVSGTPGSARVQDAPFFSPSPISETGEGHAPVDRQRAQSVDAAADAAYRFQLARNLFPQLCDAVTELHEGLPTPLIHRDLKPENVIVTPAGVPVLIDFGIARTYKTAATTDTVHFGTADYAPPEQYGFGQTDARSDVYALGLVLWFCLTGRVPAPSDRELAYTAPDVPEPLRQVIVRATAFDPADRFPSARALRAAFEQACCDLPDAECLQQESASSSVLPGEGKHQATGTAAPRIPDPPQASTSEHAVAALKARVPAVPVWLGRTWNVCETTFFILLLVACVMSVVDPSEQDAGSPLWFLVYEYVLYLWGIFIGAWYALLDKRRLRARFPSVSWPSALRAWAVTAAYLFIGGTLLVLFANGMA